MFAEVVHACQVSLLKFKMGRSELCVLFKFEKQDDIENFEKFYDNLKEKISTQYITQNVEIQYDSDNNFISFKPDNCGIKFDTSTEDVLESFHQILRYSKELDLKSYEPTVICKLSPSYIEELRSQGYDEEQIKQKEEAFRNAVMNNK